MAPRDAKRNKESGYDSEKDAYLEDLAEFVNGVTGDHLDPAGELHWSDVAWTDGTTYTDIGYVGYVSELLASLQPSESTHMKILFFLSVTTQFLKVMAVSAGQCLLPWYYVLTCPVLIAWRIYTYSKLQWQYFCLDYCYFGNLAVLLIVIFAPQDPRLFILAFCIANGLLYTGAFSFRNSLVFHSVDKMTSTYIHSAPVLLVFGVRWWPGEASRYWHTPFPEEFLDWNVRWNVVAPLCFVCVHAAVYTVLVYGILRPEEHIITSFRYLRAKAGVKAVFGPSPPFVYFLLMQLLVVLFMTGVTVLTYSSYLANLAQVVLLTLTVTWNGAGYYVDVFRMSARKHKTKK